jgi:formate hydrogenlyase subunit 3/multisubunit Na+/H+ antiporter MnhD subunit
MSMEQVALLAVMALPVIGAVFSLLMPGEDRLALRQIGMASLSASGLLSLWVALEASSAPWTVSVLGIALRVDGLSGLVLVSLAFGGPIALRAGAPRVHERSQFYVATVLFAHGLLVAAVLVDAPLVRLSIAALTSVPLFALVALFGGPMRGTTTYRAALIWIGADLAALSVLALLSARAGLHPGEATVAALARGYGTLGATERALVAVVLAGPGLLRFAAGPFSVWLQSFLEEAPVSAAMLAAMGAAPLGVLLLTDLAIPATPGGLLSLATPIAWIAGGAALLSGIIVIAERDLRRITAQLTFLAAAAATPALVSAGGAAIAAGVVHVVLTGAVLALLLGVTEAIERRFETRDASALVGLSATAPLPAALLAIGLLGLVGVPALGAGGSLWLAVGALFSPGAYDSSATLALAAALAAAHALAAAGAIATLRRVLSPPTARGRHDAVRVTFAQGARLMVPTALAIAGGIFAATLAGLAEGPARERAAIVQRAGERSLGAGAAR